MLPWKQEVHRSKMHVLNLTNIYEVCNSHNCKTVTMNKRKCYTIISLPIAIKHSIRGPNGGLILVILVAQGGRAKIKKLFEKKSNPFYKLKLIVPNLFCVCYVLCASVYMCFVVTCWERADLLALVCGVFCEFVTFQLVSWVRCGT